MPLIALVHPGPDARSAQVFRTHCEADLYVASIPCGNSEGSLDETCLLAAATWIGSTRRVQELVDRFAEIPSMQARLVKQEEALPPQ